MNSDNQNTGILPPKGRSVVFYNVENMFDTLDDPGVHDADYTPEGRKKWTKERYHKKVNGIGKVISSITKELPIILGLAEIEKEECLDDILETDPLKGHNYDYVHEHGPDSRGTDVALLYDTRYFEYELHESLEIDFPWSHRIKVRNILYVKGKMYGDDTLHIFVNHWPARTSGLDTTESKRWQAAWVVKRRIEQVFADDPDAKILIMGDFNDTPDNDSLNKVINASQPDNIDNGEFVNLSYPAFLQGEGTYLHNGEWDMLDQIIVSDQLFRNDSGIRIMSGAVAQVYSPEWLFNPNTAEKEIFMTYDEDEYKGGYSDHLPVYIILDNK